MLLSPSLISDRTQNLELQTVPYPLRESECVRTIERVSQALRTTCQWAFREIEVSVREGVVRIEGQVASYYQKQLAQETVRKLLPQTVIRNELNVVTWRDGRSRG
ncbi:MAG: BON domain-containing protein [Rhodopirellula sp.]|nr:BON domain-containing protein [Rhodopirellula sp.]